MNPIPVVLCIDVEPDLRLVDRTAGAPWLGFEQLMASLHGLRPTLAELSGRPVHYSWFFRLDPQVAECYGDARWPLAHYGELVQELLGAGDDVGIHPHAWSWDAAEASWTVNLADQPWIDHCVRTSVSAYEDSLDRPCRSFRFGDQWLSQATVDLEHQLGVRYDLTLEPGDVGPETLRQRERWTGAMPDLRAVPRVPYRPMPGNYTAPDTERNDGLWMIPMSTAAVSQRRRGLRSRIAPLRRDRDDGLAGFTRPRLARKSVGPTAFRRTLLGVLRAGVPHLALVVRSSVGLSERKRRQVNQNLEALLATPRRQFAIVTPGEAIELLGLEHPAANRGG